MSSSSLEKLAHILEDEAIFFQLSISKLLKNSYFL
jgi:hypothetical protein